MLPRWLFSWLAVILGLLGMSQRIHVQSRNQPPYSPSGEQAVGWGGVGEVPVDTARPNLAPASPDCLTIPQGTGSNNHFAPPINNDREEVLSITSISSVGGQRVGNVSEAASTMAWGTALPKDEVRTIDCCCPEKLLYVKSGILLSSHKLPSALNNQGVFYYCGPEGSGEGHNFSAARISRGL